jgi:hypothetical protein
MKWFAASLRYCGAAIMRRFACALKGLEKIQLWR